MQRQERKAQALQFRLLGMTYAAIGKELGVSRQRVQQWLRPPKPIYDIVRAKAQGKCEMCGIFLGYGRGDVHHKTLGREGDWNDLENLQLLCPSCHFKKEGD